MDTFVDLLVSWLAILADEPVVLLLITAKVFTVLEASHPKILCYILAPNCILPIRVSCEHLGKAIINLCFARANCHKTDTLVIGRYFFVGDIFHPGDDILAGACQFPLHTGLHSFDRINLVDNWHA